MSSIRSHIRSSVFKENSIGESIKDLFGDLDGRKTVVSTATVATQLKVNIFLQEDAQEFFYKLSSGLDKSYVSFEGMKKYPFSEILRGQLEQVIRCKDVDFESRKQQLFLDLSVEVEDLVTLEDSLNKYFEADYLTGDNKYKAGEYGRQDAEKRLAVLSVPQTICIHLKRFTYDMNADGMTKVKSRSITGLNVI